MEEVFIKIYVLISLWFWAGMLLSNPLRRAFSDMHCRVLKRIYDATCGRVIKIFRKIIASISKKFKRSTLYFENRSYELQVNIARSLVSEKILKELTQKDYIEAISRERQIDQWNLGVPYDELEKLAHLITGKAVSKETTETAVKTAFKLSNTVLLQDIITKIPHAQERILLAFDQAEGNAPYDSIKNEEFRKFIRE